MKIETTIKTETEKIGEIKAGDCFQFVGVLYMKAGREGYDVDNNVINAVNLANGQLLHLLDSSEALPVKVKVVNDV